LRGPAESSLQHQSITLNYGPLIRFRITKEIREAFAKQVASMAESSKKRLREIRQDVMSACKEHLKDRDVLQRSEREAQKIVEALTTRLEKLLQAKQKEITSQ
jgi:ribosome recycling factor